jgi:wyosine [tRNA(Phe)-imidazoG37] synthetase (radical SAM superfamily)
MRVKRCAFYRPGEIFGEAREKIERAKEIGESIDYLTFVADGEPALDLNLGREIELLRPLGIKIAVISNASLIWHKDVREDLMKADWVSLKVDSVQEAIWRKINRPHQHLNLVSILDGILAFAGTFKGKLVTETMLVKDINDSDDHITEIADFLARLGPAIAYLSIPTRPPAVKWVQPPGEEVINQAYQILNKKNDSLEYLIGYEGNTFAFTGDVEEDLLSITAVHPMREEALNEFLPQAGADWSIIHKMVAQGQLIQMNYKGKNYYMRRLPTRHR